MSPENPSTLLTLVQTIERICVAHVGVADFDYGDLQVFNNKHYSYPLAYLETIQDLQENRNGSEHTYTVVLNLVDRKATAAADSESFQDYVALQDKLMQIFFEIKSVMQLDYFFSKERVGAADLLIFADFADAQTIRLRAEFQVEVESVDNKTPDLAQIFPGLF